MNLFNLIDRNMWNEAINRIESTPGEAHIWNRGTLPIHRACCGSNAPIKLLEALIKAYPNSLEQRTEGRGLIPLHFSVFGGIANNISIIKLLLSHYKDGASVTDIHGYTTLQFYLCESSQPSLTLIKLLLEANPDAVHTRDRYQRYPLHCTAYVQEWKISKYLLGLYPDALLEKTVYGQTPRDIAKTFGQRDKYEKFIEEERKLKETKVQTDQT